MHCRTFGRTAKSASTAEVVEHGTYSEAEACAEDWLQTDSNNKFDSALLGLIRFSFPVR